MKLVYVFMVLGESKLVAGVDDGGGKLRRINANWHALGDEALLPPTTWPSTVQGEADFQRANEAHPNPLRNIR